MIRTIVFGVLLAVPCAVPAAEPSQVIVAQFRTVTSHGKDVQRTSWSMYRADNRIEIDRPADKLTDLWTRRGNEIERQRYFHPDKRIITFTQADMRSLGADVEWQRISSVISPSWLGKKLKPTGNTRLTFAGKATRYKGEVNGVTYDVWWLPSHDIPFSVSQRHADERVAISLLSLAGESKPLLDPKVVSDYSNIDFADLGDKETDPFVRKLNHPHAAHRH